MSPLDSAQATSSVANSSEGQKIGHGYAISENICVANILAVLLARASSCGTAVALAALRNYVEETMEKVHVAASQAGN